MENNMKKNMYIYKYMHNWVIFLYSSNNIIILLYFNKKE